MQFGEIPVGEAQGAILAHSVKHAGGVFKKGRVLNSADLALIAAAGVSAVFAARLDLDDVPEDEAAYEVARAIAGPGAVVQEPFTGRANLHAAAAGLAVIDAERVQALNRLHESLTLATVAPFDSLDARQMVATVKVIPFAVPRAVLNQALAIARGEPLVQVAAFEGKRAGLVITRLAQTKAALIAKTEEAVRARLGGTGGTLGEIKVVAHSIAAVADAVRALAGAGHDPVLVFGASAIVDRGDVIPAGLVAAGGAVEHLGMPVDPGNLSMLGRLGATAVIGVPSCARSPKLNGFDWILQRVMAGLKVSRLDIMDMGAGGLLKEIPTRPSPRETQPQVQKSPRIAAILLAAGLSSRMGGANKLLADAGGMAMVRRSAAAVLASGASPLIVVTGHQADAVRAALGGLAVSFAHNPNFASGLASSLKTGLAGLPAEADGVIVALGDMPLVEPRHIAKLIAAFHPAEHRSACVPVSGGQRGNPVLWGRQHFAALRGLEGDRGARGLLEGLGDDVAEVAIASDAVLKDFDTKESLAELGRGNHP